MKGNSKEKEKKLKCFLRQTKVKPKKLSAKKSLVVVKKRVNKVCLGIPVIIRSATIRKIYKLCIFQKCQGNTN